MMALFEPANSMFPPIANATTIVLFEPTISSHVQPPVKVSVLLLPKMWAPPRTLELKKNNWERQPRQQGPRAKPKTTFKINIGRSGNL